MKKKFREMHDHAQEEQLKQQAFNQQAAAKKPAAASHNSDYIDFEEIK